MADTTKSAFTPAWLRTILTRPSSSRRATAVPSDTAETAPTQRDRHLQQIAERGRMAWQKSSGYTTRARAEAAIGRFKQVIGGWLRSRTDQRRATKVDVAVHALNRMVEIGRPNYVRTAYRDGATAPAPRSMQHADERDIMVHSRHGSQAVMHSYIRAAGTEEAFTSSALWRRKDPPG